MRTESVAPRALRRIAIAAQGLHRRRPWGAGRPGAAAAVAQLGYVQIDTISVVARAHEHVLWSRVPGFRASHIDDLVRERSIFEYWAHAAAFLPMRDFRFALPRMRRLAAGGRHWVGRDARAMAWVRDRVRAEGPLRARDFETPPGHVGGWWSWKPAKRALERLFHEGELLVTSRDGFEKRFDLAERVLPAWVDTRVPRLPEYAEHLVATTARSLGAFTRRECTYQRREPGLDAAVDAALSGGCEAGTLVPLDAPDGGAGRWYADAARLEAPHEPIRREVRVLSPFDNALIHRDRLRRLFGFDYQLECYRRPQERVYGYFALPLLYGERFVGRADCKADRRRSRFEVRSLHLEGRRPPPPEAIARALGDYARFTGCEGVRAARPSGVTPGAGRAMVAALERSVP